MLKGKHILLISPEAWGQNFVSKHHYAHYLAKDNTVYFLNPVNGSGLNPFENIDAQLVPISERIIAVNYKNLIPKLNHQPKFIQSAIYKRQAKQILAALHTAPDIVWSFDPYRFFNQEVWNADTNIYHAVDCHNQCFEADIAKSSDIVLLTSETFRNRLRNYNDNIHFTGHALDLDNFLNETTHQITIPGQQNIKAGLIGSFNKMVDYRIMMKMAKLNTSVDFIFIGPYQDSSLDNSTHVAENIKKLKALDNVFFIGSVPAKTLPHWLRFFDINLILYKEDYRYMAVNPHKVMGYFYAGNITISSWIEEYITAESTLIYMTESNDNIPKMIAEVAQDIDYWNRSEFVSQRQNFAKTNTYAEKIKFVEKLISSQ